jgi:glycine/D-amino acid oxidase-like deaminating enzyme
MGRIRKVVVVGAGAFGGWTALHLLRLGIEVTLLDAWGPGNPRSSSGGETRIIRGAYGHDQPYTEMTARAMKLWRIHEKKWKRKFFHSIGVLFMAADGDDQWETGSCAALQEAGIAFERLSLREMKRRWPQIHFEGLHWGLFEPDGGYLTARASCQAVVNGFVAEGGRYLRAVVRPDGLEDGLQKGVLLGEGSHMKADRYVFACGPWMGQLFPKAIGRKIRATQQEIFFFGVPAGDMRFDEKQLPVWADHRGRFLYGIPGHGARAFKIADDTRGMDFEPTSGERVASPERAEVVREYMEFRFPAMKGAPLIKGRVCQYEQTADSHFIVDRHPEDERIWLVGGGSGHGFKHGPALGEVVAQLVLKDEQAHPCWRLGRFR